MPKRRATPQPRHAGPAARAVGLHVGRRGGRAGVAGVMTACAAGGARDGAPRLPGDRRRRSRSR